MAELKPSKLGTKEHWDHVYKEELANFHDIGEEGEIWFGEDTLEKMVDWCLEHLPPSSSNSLPSILEIGSGNGTLLFALAEAGYPPRLLSGIDYSSDAIKLSQAIALTRGSGAEAISFKFCDFLTQDPSLGDAQFDGWDLILDKGTFDAMALGEKDEEGHAPSARYPDRLVRLLKPGGRFLITSCNFTEDELKTAFISPQTGLIFQLSYF